MRQQIEKIDRVHLVGVREIRIIAAPDNAFGRGSNQRLRDKA